MIGTGRMPVGKDVSEMISSWEKLNERGGGEALSREMPNENDIDGGGGQAKTLGTSAGSLGRGRRKESWRTLS